MVIKDIVNKFDGINSIIKLSSNDLLCNYMLSVTHTLQYIYYCRQIDSLWCAQLHSDKYFTLAWAVYT